VILIPIRRNRYLKTGLPDFEILINSSKRHVSRNFKACDDSDRHDNDFDCSDSHGGGARKMGSMNKPRDNSQFPLP
jgi:hypothetical protein